MAPQTLSAGVQGSEAGSGGSRWKRLALGLALGIVAVGAGAAFAAQHAHQSGSAGQGGGAPPSTAQAPSTTQAAASPATATAALASVPGDATSTKPSLDRKSLAKQQPIAKSLAQKYADAAVRIAALVSSGRSSPALDSLVASLHAVETAYRRAASAARSGDVAAYSAATTEIDASKNRVRQAITALNGQGQSGGNSSGTTPLQGGSTTGSACSGDSTSDDPSDDQCAAP